MNYEKNEKLERFYDGFFENFVGLFKSRIGLFFIFTGQFVIANFFIFSAKDKVNDVYPCIINYVLSLSVVFYVSTHIACRSYSRRKKGGDSCEIYRQRAISNFWMGFMCTVLVACVVILMRIF